ncbi:MAG: DUF2141 domain-containing protein [Deltaproteobacteria bacterium]|nr:MAG: DUF2141 domain-containing protein [Deltaproteobacteria bacterium]
MKTIVMKWFWLGGLSAWLCLGAWTTYAEKPTPRPAARITKATQGTLIVRVTGFRNAKGHALIAVYRSAKGFPGKYKLALFQRVSTIREKQATFRLKNLKFGTYAIASFHDANDNKKLDTGVFGIPTEAYGASRNARRTFGPPRFKDAKFRFTKNKQVVTFWVK